MIHRHHERRLDDWRFDWTGVRQAPWHEDAGERNGCRHAAAEQQQTRPRRGPEPGPRHARFDHGRRTGASGLERGVGFAAPDRFACPRRCRSAGRERRRWRGKSLHYTPVLCALLVFRLAPRVLCASVRFGRALAVALQRGLYFRLALAFRCALALELLLLTRTPLLLLALA
jgi:hypothetical protein